MSVVAKRNHRSHRSIPSLLAGLTLTLAATVSVQATQYKVIYSFRNGPGFSDGLIRDADGNFLGAARGGGSFDHGGVRAFLYKITPAGALTVLHTFSSPSYIFDVGAITLDAKGVIYGVVDGGGDAPCRCGFLYSLAPNGAFKTLYSFSGPPNGSRPLNRLILDPDGNIYGTTNSIPEGAGAAASVLFELSAQGSYRVLHTFKGQSGGLGPSSVVRDSDGNLYGTTYGGGAYDKGTVFKFSPTGRETILHSFYDHGGDPLHGVFRDQQGNLWGTAEGIKPSASYVFKLAPGGAVTTTTVTTEPYVVPTGGLIRDTAGNIYGLTGSGSGPCGFVYKITPGRQVFVLHRFGMSGDGCQGSGRLSSDKAGHLFGTTIDGGKFGHGVVFELSEE